MGSSQLLLYALGVIMILAVIAMGAFLFREHEVSANKDAIIIDLESIASDLEQYSLRPESIGGGDGSYDGYTIPSRLVSNDDATYAVSIVGAPKKGHGHGYGLGRDHGVGNNRNQTRGKLTITGTSKNGFGTVIMSVDDSTSTKVLTFTGQFQ